MNVSQTKTLLSGLFAECCLLLIKVYPGQRSGGIEADMMAANELNAHAFLQVRQLWSKGV